MLSSAYQMSAAWSAAAAERDPDNRLLWRFSRRRLEAEEYRDSLLAISGVIDFEMGGSLLRVQNRQYVTSTANVNYDQYRSSRRTIYLPVVRSAVFDVLWAMDFPEPSVTQGQRESTTMATQALLMMNSELVHDAALKLADRLLADADSDTARIERAHELCMQRAPRPEEVERGLAFLSRQMEIYREAAAASDEVSRRAWESYCRALFGANEFLYVE
jgi:hypothetical protein